MEKNRDYEYPTRTHRGDQLIDRTDALPRVRGGVGVQPPSRRAVQSWIVDMPQLRGELEG